MFHALHNLFLTPNGVYLMIFNAEELLPSKTTATAVTCMWYIREWFNSVFVFAPGAPVFIVGTCLDKMPPEEMGRTAACENMSKMIWNAVLRNHPGQGQVVRNNELCCFFVDNTAQPEHESVTRLRKKVGSVVTSQSHVDDKVPLNWLRVLDRVNPSSMSDAERGRDGVTPSEPKPSRVTRDQFREAARACGLGHHEGITLDDEVDALLSKFHDLGLVLWCIAPLFDACSA